MGRLILAAIKCIYWYTINALMWLLFENRVPVIQWRIYMLPLQSPPALWWRHNIEKLSVSLDFYGGSISHRWIPLQRPDNAEWVLMFSLSLLCTSCWTNRQNDGDFRRYDTHMTIMTLVATWCIMKSLLFRYGFTLIDLCQYKPVITYAFYKYIVWRIWIVVLIGTPLLRHLCCHSQVN